MKTFLC